MHLLAASARARPLPRLSRRRRLAPALRGLAAAAWLAWAAGCSRPAAEDEGVRVELTVSPQPPVVGTARVAVRLRDAAGRPLPATAVALEANMTHPGMRPSLANARLQPPDGWLADLELPMAGDWVVTVEARLADGRTVRREVPLPGVESR